MSFKFTKLDLLRYRFVILLTIGFSLVTYNIISTRTSWLQASPLWCGTYDQKTKTYKTISPASIEQTRDRVCLKEIYRPYSYRMGDIRVGISIQQKNHPLYYFDTTFWMAENLGDKSFTDQRGDFTTHSISFYSEQGVLNHYINDSPSGWSDLDFNPSSFLSICRRVPFFLNDLHLHDNCRDAQVALWDKIKSDFINTYLYQYLSLHKVAYQQFALRLPLMIFLVFLALTLRSLTNLLRQFSADKNTSSSEKLASILKTVNTKLFFKIFSFGTITMFSVVISLSLISSRTNWLKPSPFLCKVYPSKQFNSIASELKQSFNITGSGFEICIHEVLSLDNSWSEAISLGISLKGDTNQTIFADTLFWIQDSDDSNTGFSDQIGDFRYTALESFNKYGLKISNIPPYITFSTWYAQILPNNVRTYLWNDINLMFRDRYRSHRISAIRKISTIFKDYLPLLIAVTIFLYILIEYLKMVLKDE